MSESPAREVDHRWRVDELPPNVEVGHDVVIVGPKAFSRFFGEQERALVIGDRSIMDGVRFGVSPTGRLTVGTDCHFSDAVVLAEDRVTIGDRVMLGWNVTVADADFHPIDLEARRRDAEACSPLGHPLGRPKAVHRPVSIGDDCWIGPNAVVLKGVSIGAGCFVEPGSVVTADVPPNSRVLGNPARVIGEAGP